MLNVRLNKDLEEKLYSLSQKKGVSKTSIVKEALVAYLKTEKLSSDAYELGEDLFGVEGGAENLAKDRRKLLKEKLHGKHSH
jgi:hypothetical protein